MCYLLFLTFCRRFLIISNDFSHGQKISEMRESPRLMPVSNGFGWVRSLTNFTMSTIYLNMNIVLIMLYLYPYKTILNPCCSSSRTLTLLFASHFVSSLKFSTFHLSSVYGFTFILSILYWILYFAKYQMVASYIRWCYTFYFHYLYVSCTTRFMITKYIFLTCVSYMVMVKLFLFSCRCFKTDKDNR